jgi:hypothetical protein
MTYDRKHDPISLPPGSFDLDDLHDVSREATKAADDKRDGKVAELLARKNQRADADSGDFPGRLPGHRLETVEIVRSEGEEVPTGRGKETAVVGRQVETRNIQVFDPKLGREEAAAAAEAAAVGAREPAPAGE